MKVAPIKNQAKNQLPRRKILWPNQINPVIGADAPHISLTMSHPTKPQSTTASRAAAEVPPRLKTASALADSATKIVIAAICFQMKIGDHPAGSALLKIWLRR